MESQAQYISDQIDEIQHKISTQLEQIKTKMIQEIHAFYKRGEGKLLTQNLEVLRREFTEGWRLDEVQESLKQLLNREITSDVFESQIHFHLKKKHRIATQQKAIQFYNSQFS